ncbi:MAG: hypothetical protein CMK98_12770 [Pseudomonas sp.]|nr:hypothetical protein [Pseudomonas sp.]
MLTKRPVCPFKDGLIPPDYDEYGDVPDSGENDSGTDSNDQPKAVQRPLGQAPVPGIYPTSRKRCICWTIRAAQPKKARCALRRRRHPAAVSTSR